MHGNAEGFRRIPDIAAMVLVDAACPDDSRFIRIAYHKNASPVAVLRHAGVDEQKAVTRRRKLRRNRFPLTEERYGVAQLKLGLKQRIGGIGSSSIRRVDGIGAAVDR